MCWIILKHDKGRHEVILEKSMLVENKKPCGPTKITLSHEKIVLLVLKVMYFASSLFKVFDGDWG